ncbi:MULTISPECIES: hypothetical protein [unclassified Bradyrhizobium]|nr:MULTISPECIES: hypothetical protein [unclassified Bradyrhizobium]MCJ9702050.1 hypothetical protein [Bradyrhizobium sp. SHOUNA76]MCJ9730552.1 hypothetical protein [Bradyrhizobium sp. PRIMUS42]
MESGAGPFPTTKLTLVERYKHAARQEMDVPELLKLLKEIEDEIRGRRVL